ncbi:hypothetical protein [Actinokineospora pegani]|uniref:hypothetical protein n=1 Tax=Actinokineospora pegani TaxID=2654637 RepID=UPI0012EA2F73|nr:hypothetical protein [Actinokineospora pegani]
MTVVEIGIQSADVGFDLDVAALLRGIPGGYARVRAEAATTFMHEAVGAIRPSARQEMVDGVEDFVVVARRLLGEALTALRRELGLTSLGDCVGLALLLGQTEVIVGLPTPSPNAFAYEIEYLASCRAAESTRTMWFASSRRRAQATFEALRLARQVRILHMQLDSASRVLTGGQTYESMKESLFGENLAEEWVSVRGSFITRYDWEYSNRLAEQMRRRGVPHPRLEALSYLVSSLLSRMYPAIAEFHAALSEEDGDLHTAATQHRLVTGAPTPRMSRRHAALIVERTRLLPITVEELLEAAPVELVDDVHAWTQHLTVKPDDLGRNTDGVRFFDSALATAPLLATPQGLLLALVHAPLSDLSRVMERVFGDQRSLPYFEARGEMVEATALEALTAVFPDAATMAGGTYAGDRPGERIEVDGVLRWKDIAIVVEGKGGFLSLRARHGQRRALLADLRSTIGDGFFQATRLLRTLDRSRRVDLVGDKGQELRLSLPAIRRAYVIIPTADKIGGMTILLDQFSRRGVLPAGALPLIVSVQDLRLMSELLATPLEFVAYLDYREEVLAHPEIQIIDEEELLGHFVAGNDIVGTFQQRKSEYSFQFRYTEWRNKVHPLFLGSNSQELHLNPWIGARETALAFGGPLPDRPRRHSPVTMQRIEQFFDDRDDLAAASCAMRFPHDAFEDFDRVGGVATRGAPALGYAGNAGIAILAPRDQVRTVRRTGRVTAFREAMRCVAYVQHTRHGLRLRHVEHTPQHVFPADGHSSLLHRSRLGDHTNWFAEFARRRGGADTELSDADHRTIAALVQAGLDEHLALGVTRHSLGARVLELADDHISLHQAADLYLTHVRATATTLDVAPSELALTTTAIRQTLNLATDGHIDPKSIPQLLHIQVTSPDTSARELADHAGLLTTHADDFTDAIRGALAALGTNLEEVHALRSADRRKLRNRLVGQVRSVIPTANAKALAHAVDDYLTNDKVQDQRA